MGHSIHVKNSVSAESRASHYFFTDEELDMVMEQVSHNAAYNGAEFVAEVIAGKITGKAYSQQIAELFVRLGGE